MIIRRQGLNCDYNSNPCGIFESMTSFTSILNQDLKQGKLMAAVNSRKQRSKNVSSGLHNSLKFGKIFWKDLLCAKM